MEDTLRKNIIGRNISSIEYSDIDEYGYTADSAVLHIDGGEELRIFVNVRCGLPSLCLELSSSVHPLAGVYPRLLRYSADTRIDDICFGYSDGRLISATIKAGGREVRLSVSDSDLYSMKID